MARIQQYANWQDTMTDEVRQYLHWFCQNTTEKILRNINRLAIGRCEDSTGELARSIHGIVYNNAGGKDAFVRFYYQNYAPYLEYGLGAYYGVDAALAEGDKRKGVKDIHVHPVTAISSAGFSGIRTTMHGIPQTYTKSDGTTADRGEVHKARPFLHSEIRIQLRRIQERLVTACAYTATAYLVQGVCRSMSSDKEHAALLTQGLVEEFRSGTGVHVTLD